MPTYLSRDIQPSSRSIEPEPAPFKSGHAIFFSCSRWSASLLVPNTLMRPRLPARSKLSTSYTKPSPPPPYGDTLEANSLSESATAHRIHALAKDVFSGAVPSAIEEWIDGQPREELSSLLVRANELIRERERGKSSHPMAALHMTDGSVSLRRINHDLGTVENPLQQ
jgi:hypothetical protein